ncbi:helix-turn-helix domain-containing protein [Chitinophaga varians]|uniref:helix-turn-helix domain-containing protein n=1 Tax=Chitinophaga varians TaxID=2202339 RepID=UPI00165FFBC3|nr:helix-turn-helix domain-containing protein [Chitinophaga varians]MBC9913851.1 helix-turn-helix transcriptional regulator [Chitinophaga varians]
MQVSPSSDLSGFIRHYLFLNIAGNHSRKLRLFSDGSSGIVLASHQTLFLDALPLPAAFCYGQITEYKEICCQGDARLIIIVFHPHGLYRLLNVPASELNDKIISLSDIFAGVGQALESAVAATDSLSVKLEHIEFYFRKMLSTHHFMGDPLVNTALDLIHRHKGVLTIQQLTDSIGCHSRQLERKFNTAIGLSPKHFCNIVRTLSFVKSLQNAAPKPNLTHCAYDSGYYDQAHLIREFRKITGLTPSQYYKHSEPLAVNLLRL